MLLISFQIFQIKQIKVSKSAAAFVLSKWSLSVALVAHGGQTRPRRTYPGICDLELPQDVLRHIVLSHGVHNKVLVTCRTLSRPVLMTLFLQNTEKTSHTQSKSTGMEHIRTFGIKVWGKMFKEGWGQRCMWSTHECMVAMAETALLKQSNQQIFSLLLLLLLFLLLFL